VPDADTIWLFREQLVRSGALDRLLGGFDAIGDIALVAVVAQLQPRRQASRSQLLDRSQASTCDGLRLRRGMRSYAAHAPASPLWTLFVSNTTCVLLRAFSFFMMCRIWTLTVLSHMLSS